MRLAHPLHPSFQAVGLWLLPAVLLVGLPLVALTGQVKGLTRYVGSRALHRLAAPQQLDPAPVVAVGEAGAQLAAALRLAGNRQIVSFLDDAPSLWRRTINGIPIQPPQVLSEIQGQLDQVLLAIPSLPRSEPAASWLSCNARRSRCCRSPRWMTSPPAGPRIDALRPVAIEDLLGRDPVPPVPELLGLGLRDAVVCVTGAGGSIGSELCRQILQLAPKTLILLESSEPSLYAVEQELLRLLRVPVCRAWRADPAA